MRVFPGEAVVGQVQRVKIVCLQRVRNGAAHRIVRQRQISHSNADSHLTSGSAETISGEVQHLQLRESQQAVGEGPRERVGHMHAAEGQSDGISAAASRAKPVRGEHGAVVRRAHAVGQGPREAVQAQHHDADVRQGEQTACTTPENLLSDKSSMMSRGSTWEEAVAVAVAAVGWAKRALTGPDSSLPSTRRSMSCCRAPRDAGSEPVSMLLLSSKFLISTAARTRRGFGA